MAPAVAPVAARNLRRVIDGIVVSSFNVWVGAGEPGAFR
jgi:hypothetical protein